MAFTLLDALFLPTIFLIGLITSYQDWKFGKIKNIWIILGLALGALGYLLFSILNIIGYGNIFSDLLENSLFDKYWPAFLKYSFLNSFAALIFGLLLYYFKLWSAGDCKLFFLFSFLLPLKYYFNGYLPIFPSLTLFINTFICLFFVLFVGALFNLINTLIKTKKGKSLIGFFQSGKIKLSYIVKSTLNAALVLLTLFLGLGMLFKAISGYLALQISPLFINVAIILTIIIFRNPLFAFFKKFDKIIISGLVLYLIILFFFFPQQSQENLDFLYRFFIMFIIFYTVFVIIPQQYLETDKRPHTSFALFLTIGTVITILLRSSLLTLVIK